MGEHLDPSLVAIPFYVAAMTWEYRRTRSMRARGEHVLGYEKRDTIASLGTGIVSVFTVGLMSVGVTFVGNRMYDHRFVSLGTGWLAWAVGMVSWDFAYYWLHRIEHSSRLFWAMHVSHHSSRHYNFSTALRQPWAPLLSFVAFPPIALLGVEPWIIMTSGGINLIYQFWIHTEAVGKMPRWFEFVFNTPSHHRVHHASNGRYLDKNHGGILIVWDRLFGTFEEEVEPVVYGLTKNVGSFNLWTVFAHEFVAIAKDAARARTWGDRLRTVFSNPGWRPSAPTDAE